MCVCVCVQGKKASRTDPVPDAADIGAAPGAIERRSCSPTIESSPAVYQHFVSVQQGRD